MRWVVYGAGAVGGVLGGLLAEAGREVVLVARGDHLRAIREAGLRLESPDGSRTIRVPAVGSAAEVVWSTEDVVLLAVKSHQTHDALEELAAHAPPDAPLVCVQNGVSNEGDALRLFEHVYGVCVMMPAGHLEPGVVQASCSPVPAILDVGRYPTGVDDVTKTLAATFEGAGMVSLPRPDIMAWKHRKLMMNLGNAVQACCGSGPAASALTERLQAEGEAVLAAAGVPVVSEAEDRDRRGDILRRGDIPGRQRGGGSSWQSLRRGTGTIETDYLNGEVVRLGRLHGVPTPVNELVRRTAVRLAREHGEPGSVDAATLLDAVGADPGGRA